MSQANEAYEVLKDSSENQIKFQTYGEEGNNIRKWIKSHKSKNKDDPKHLDDYGDYMTDYTYLSSNTGVGTVVRIRCYLCGEEYNATDYSIW